MLKIGLVAAGVVVGLLAAVAIAQTARSYGAMPSHRVVETFDISVGLSAGGRTLRPREVQQSREVLALPDFYGQLVGVTGDSKAVVLWFRDEEGRIRNVPVVEADDVLVLVQPTAVKDLELESFR